MYIEDFHNTIKNENRLLTVQTLETVIHSAASKPRTVSICLDNIEGMNYIDSHAIARELFGDSREEVVSRLLKSSRGIFLIVTFQLSYLAQLPDLDKVLKELEIIDQVIDEKKMLESPFLDYASKYLEPHLQDMDPTSITPHMRMLFDGMKAVEVLSQKKSEAKRLLAMETNKGVWLKSLGLLPFWPNTNADSKHVDRQDATRQAPLLSHQPEQDNIPGYKSRSVLNGQKVYFLPAETFAREISLSDTNCILSPKGTFRAPGDKVWICQLNSDVNLRLYLPTVPKGLYTVMWLFSYQIKSEYKASSSSRETNKLPQRYNISVGRALDPDIFMARVRDLSQPFVLANLNTFLNLRLTTQITVPLVKTQEMEDPHEVLVDYPPQGDIQHPSGGPLDVNWDDGGGLAFLINLVSPRSLEGELNFHGAHLYRLRSQFASDLRQQVQQSGP
ncbi:hypothetical protein B0H63DRAFT_453624 [Podospora didyma]|uniref:Uncharacterized protein n=1 Tax=Podospora didyma TaxID=330526 RepID=A0AAE0K8W1_9PEZI|nr:hypothetical protein B0H63DRAFT_453624 [Podospora didyma]